jgi:hypothetical protein
MLVLVLCCLLCCCVVVVLLCCFAVVLLCRFAEAHIYSSFYILPPSFLPSFSSFLLLSPPFPPPDGRGWVTCKDMQNGKKYMQRVDLDDKPIADDDEDFDNGDADDEVRAPSSKIRGFDGTASSKLSTDGGGGTPSEKEAIKSNEPSEYDVEKVCAVGLIVCFGVFF